MNVRRYCPERGEELQLYIAGRPRLYYCDSCDAEWIFQRRKLVKLDGADRRRRPDSDDFGEESTPDSGFPGENPEFLVVFDRGPKALRSSWIMGGKRSRKRTQMGKISNPGA